MRKFDHKIETVRADFWVTDGRYPTSYTSGVGATIDLLKPRILHAGNYYIEFLGWYLDEGCKTTPFDGTIDPDQTGDIVLYAKTRETPLSSSVDSSGWVGEK